MASWRTSESGAHCILSRFPLDDFTTYVVQMGYLSTDKRVTRRIACKVLTVTLSRAILMLNSHALTQEPWGTGLLAHLQSAEALGGGHYQNDIK